MIDVTENELRDALAASLNVPRWIDEVAARAPFASAAELLAAAYEAATPLGAHEIDEAIRDHPRIGEKPVGDGASQRFSRSEQAALDDDAQVAAQIAAGNEAYEERFGRVFIIRAAGRTRAEILEELERRLELPNASELEIVGEQLRDIALLRLEQTFGETTP
jgi:2-oxo-4-hydroxy-4-carboxy-5-ureidoimidazoline decarboxylase